MRETASNTASSPNQWLRVQTLFVMTDSLDLQQLASQTSQQLGPLVQVQLCPQSPWNPPDQQDPQKQDPQKQDLQKQGPQNPLVPLDHLVQQPLNHLRA